MEEEESTHSSQVIVKRGILAVFMIVMGIVYVSVLLLVFSVDIVSITVIHSISANYAITMTFCVILMGVIQPYLFIACIVLSLVYLLRWVHFKVEKSRVNDRDIQGGFNTLLTFFNLEGKAQKVRSGAMIEIFEEKNEMNVGQDIESEPAAQCDIKGNEFKKPFVSLKFSTSVETLTFPLFGRIHETHDALEIEATKEDEDDHSNEGFVIEVFRVTKVITSSIFVLIGTTADWISVIAWTLPIITTIVTWLQEYREIDQKVLQATVSITAILAINLLGIHVSVISALPQYFKNLVRKVPGGKSDDKDAEELDDDDEVYVSLSRRIIGILVTVFLFPFVLLGRLLNGDIFVHVVNTFYQQFIVAPFKRNSSEKIYNQQRLFWQVGKALPSLFVQVITFGNALYFFSDGYFFEGLPTTDAIFGIATMSLSALSFCTTFISVVSSIVSMSKQRYGDNFFIWGFNFALLQASSILIRLFIVATVVSLGNLFAASLDPKSPGVTDGVSAIIGLCMIFYTCLFPYFLASILVRLILLLIPSFLLSLRNIRIFYVPLHAAKLEIAVDAFMGAFGAIYDANPSTSIMVNVIVNLIEIFIPLINLTVLVIYGLQSIASIDFSVDHSMQPRIYLFFCIAQFVFIAYFATFIVYTTTFMIHLFLFPIYRYKPLLQD